jgi:hypothetical protein
MLRYNAKLKGKVRQLRKNMTDSENVLWSRLRSKQPPPSAKEGNKEEILRASDGV